MSNKFNANALNEYSRSYARRVANDFYQQNTVISGKQILNLTPIGQVNLFVVNSLFEKWKADAEKFRSPYFDFTHPEVEQALRSFMNVVSQHIAVRREHLEPLLADAVRRTLCLLFDPRGYFDELLRELPEFTLTSSMARQLTRFTQIHKVIPATIEQRMNGKSFIYANQALNYLDEVLAQHSHELDRYDKYVPMFGATIPLDLATLLRAHVPDSIVNNPARSFFDDSLDPTEAKSQVQSIPAILSINQPVDAGMVSERPETVHYEATEAVIDHTIVEPSGIKQPQEMPTVVYRPVAQPYEGTAGGPHFVNQDSTSFEEPLNPVVQPSQPYQTSIQVSVDPTETPEKNTFPASGTSIPEQSETLNDRLRDVSYAAATATESHEVTSVAEAFQRAPIESMAKRISLNQKFRFINQLFNGNPIAYNQAIAELDIMPDYGQALDLISYRYATQYLWDMTSDEVSELVEILKRRFA